MAIRSYCSTVFQSPLLPELRMTFGVNNAEDLRRVPSKLASQPNAD